MLNFLAHIRSIAGTFFGLIFLGACFGIFLPAGYYSFVCRLQVANVEGHIHSGAQQESADKRSPLTAVINSPAIIEQQLSESNEATSKDQDHDSPIFCDTRISDILLVFFTYCLVVVGWFTMRSNQETMRELERARFHPKFIRFERNSEHDPKPTIHYGFINTGRSVGTVYSFLIVATVVGPITGSEPDYLGRRPFRMMNGIHPGSTLGTEPPDGLMMPHVIQPDVTPADYAAMAAGERIILVRGYIQFKDVYGISRTQRFAAGTSRRIDGNLLGFDAGSYNTETQE